MDDPIVDKLYSSSEEGQKVTRNKGDKYLAIFKRIEDPFCSSWINFVIIWFLL